ncbi:hypothetical protein EDD11_002121 [Mortierella claussenii]|nr:hypothetical protein EDD11_002121 [Mortierella claussenii]
MDTDEVKEAICDIPGVLEVKTLHVWSLTIGHAALSGVIYLQPEIKDLRRAAEIVQVVRRMIRRRFGIRQCTVQVELYSPHAQSLSLQQQMETHTTSGTHSHSGVCNTHSLLPIDAPAKHDQDIIFSIGEEDLQDTMMSSHQSSHSTNGPRLLVQEATRAGTPLSQYRDNRRTHGGELDDEDESETEMEQEEPMRAAHSQWV